MRNLSIIIGAIMMFNWALMAQTNQVQFGKNRVQYHHHFDEWLQYESDNFVTYWYGEGRYIGQAAVMIAEKDFADVQSTLEHKMNDKIEIIVYTDITDLKQSNIGSEEAFANTGGKTKIVGNKIFVYFDGNHNHLQQQIREGIASVYINAMLFGSNLQEIVQNAVMLNLPEWYKQGLIAYIGKAWDTDLDNKLRDIIANKQYKNFNRFADAQPELAGHALWYFISQNFGKSTVSNLLYLTRINRNMDSGFLYVLGADYQKITANMMDYFRARYEKENSQLISVDSLSKIPLKNKRHLPITALKISPDGKQVAYVTNEIGRFSVWVQEVKSGKRKLVMKSGFRNNFQATDYNYPLLGWHPNNHQLTILYEKRDVIKIRNIDLNTNKSTTDDFGPEYQRVYNIDYMNADEILVSGTVRGVSDIFIFRTKNRNSERITNDFYDDLDPVFVNIENKKGILFASNRRDSSLSSMKLDSILPIGNFDIWYYPLSDTTKQLVRVTNTPTADERCPMPIDTTWFSYLSDETGIKNRFVGYLKDVVIDYKKYIYQKDKLYIVSLDSVVVGLDSTLIDSIRLVPIFQKKAFVHNNSNYNRNLDISHTAPQANKQVSLIWSNQGHHIILQDINTNDSLNNYKTTYQKNIEINKNNTKKDTVISVLVGEKNNNIILKDTTTIIKPSSYLFQSEFDEEPTPSVAMVNPEKAENTIVIEKPAEIITLPEENNFTNDGTYRFRQTRIIPSRLKFKADYVTTQLDNSLLFGGLDSYAGTPQGFETPPLGILLKSNVKDLFEDYIFEGGMRIPTTFNGTEFFLTFEDKKHRWDKRYSIYRRAMRFSNNDNPNQIRRWRNTLFLTQTEFRYPFDIFRSLRFTGTLRLDKLITLASDVPTLESPSLREQRIGIKAEYVFDNTIETGLNMKAGTRYKFYTEALKRFNLSLGEKSSLTFNKGWMAVLGFDARHYHRIDRKSILAVRAAASTSVGSEKVLYYLGGVDNWMFAKFDQSIPLPQDENFAYQTIATNLRGFAQNIRNGNSYALVNTELRVPLFQYFYHRPIQSAFWRNFQLVGFFDFGTAWTGATPFARENPLNTIILPNPPTVIVKVNYFRDPIVAGYGVGFRSLIFGYFIRLDYAWGIETRISQKPLLHLSLGYDF